MNPANDGSSRTNNGTNTAKHAGELRKLLRKRNDHAGAALHLDSEVVDLITKTLKDVTLRITLDFAHRRVHFLQCSAGIIGIGRQLGQRALPRFAHIFQGAGILLNAGDRQPDRSGAVSAGYLIFSCTRALARCPWPRAPASAPQAAGHSRRQTAGSRPAHAVAPVGDPDVDQGAVFVFDQKARMHPQHGMAQPLLAPIEARQFIGIGPDVGLAVQPSQAVAVSVCEWPFRRIVFPTEEDFVSPERPEDAEFEFFSRASSGRINCSTRTPIMARSLGSI